MKAVILAAGRGQRFRDEGFSITKPLINYKGWPLIAHAIAQVGGSLEELMVISTPDVCAYLKTTYPEVKSIEVNTIQRGPGMTSLLVSGNMADNEKIFLIDCDVIFSDGCLSDFIISRRFKLDGKDPDAAILTTQVEGSTENYCSVTGVEDTVTSIDEKIVNGSGKVAVGCYYFKNFDELRRAVFNLYQESEDEVYISSVLKRFLRDGKVIISKDIPAEKWTPVGTPKELLEADNENE